MSQQTEILPYTNFSDWFCKTEVESVYWAVRTESLYNTESVKDVHCLSACTLHRLQVHFVGPLSVISTSDISHFTALKLQEPKSITCIVHRS